MMSSKDIKRIAVVLLAVFVLALFAACGGGTTQQVQQSTQAVKEETQQTASTEESKKAPEPAKISIYQYDTFEVPGVQSDMVAKEIEKITGVTMDIINPDENKFKVMLAGGDLPDMLITSQSYMKQLIEGNNIIPLDDLIKTNGSELANANPERIAFSKKYMSNGTDKLYFLPIHAGPNEPRYHYDVGYTVRWDYYKELGYPEVKNEDDFLKVLSDMQKKHPTTDDGKKVYGVSAWSDWGGLWPFIINHVMGYGYYNSSAFFATDMQDNAVNLLLDEQSPLWKALKFYNNADQLGLLDHESFTQKFDNYITKMKNLQYLTTLTYGLVPYGGVNDEFTKNGHPEKGFETLPGFMPYFFKGGYSSTGWNDKLISISRNYKTPDRAMDLLNFTFSYEGSRLIASGVQDVNWKLIDGKPEITDETNDIIKNKPDEAKNIGIGTKTKYSILQGLNDSVVDPKDRGLINLFLSDKQMRAQVKDLDKEYSEYYGVTYPGEVIDKMAKDDKLKLGEFNLIASSALAVAPDDVKRIDVKIEDYMKKAIVKIILAKSNDEFEVQKKKAIEDMKKMGLEQSNEFWSKAWKDAKAIADQYRK